MLHELAAFAVRHVQVIHTLVVEWLQRVQCLIVIPHALAPLDLGVETHIPEEQLCVHLFNKLI